MAELEASKADAVAGALRDRSKAAALEKSEVHAKKEFDRFVVMVCSKKGVNKTDGRNSINIYANINVDINT